MSSCLLHSVNHSCLNEISKAWSPLKCVMARVQQQNRKLSFFGYCGFVHKGTIAIFGMLVGFIFICYTSSKFLLYVTIEFARK